MKNGPYTLIIAPAGYTGRRYRGRYAYEHHVVYWECFGRLVQSGFILHHRNGNKQDNRIENLELLNLKEHNTKHRSVAPIVFTCAYCGVGKQLKPSKYRTRIKNSKYGRIYCSRSCAVSAQHRMNVS